MINDTSKAAGYVFPMPTFGRNEILTDDEIAAIVNGMPGGLEGFCKSWGWLQLARFVERRVMDKGAKAVAAIIEDIKDDAYSSGFDEGFAEREGVE